MSTRTEDGLPLVPTRTNNALIESCLAKAQAKYPVTLVCYLFMANHFHAIVIVRDPEAASAFVGYVKQEITHGVNRLLGRRQKTIWKCEFDSPILLDGERCLQEIAYTYTNPCEANLVEYAREYIGVHSLTSLEHDGVTEKEVPTFKRSDFTKLANPKEPFREDRSYHSSLVAGTKTKEKIVINPWAIRQVFPEFAQLTFLQLHSRIYAIIDLKVKDLIANRKSKGQRVAGVEKLRRMSMLLTYVPQKYSRKSVCLGSTRQTVMNYLIFFNDLVEQAKDVYQRWKRNDFSVLFPVGMYPPRLPKTGSLLAAAVAF